MNRYQCGLDGYKFEDAYNRTLPRVKQGQTRASKGNYRPKGVRASHHHGPLGLKKQPRV